MLSLYFLVVKGARPFLRKTIQVTAIYSELVAATRFAGVFVGQNVSAAGMVHRLINCSHRLDDPWTTENTAAQVLRRLLLPDGGVGSGEFGRYFQ